MPLPSTQMQGNLTDAPQLRYTNAGKAWVTFTVACNERRKNEAGEWIDGDTTFLDVVAWRNAEAIAKLTKGARVVVVGDLKQRDFEDKDGNKRRGYQVDALYVASLITDATGQPSVAPVGTPTSWATPAATTRDLDDEYKYRNVF